MNDVKMGLTPLDARQDVAVAGPALPGSGAVGPIGTAPKDGSDILLFGRDENGQLRWLIGRWVKSERRWWEQVSDTKKLLQVEDTSDWETDRLWMTPTHWARLPVHPTAPVQESSTAAVPLK